MPRFHITSPDGATYEIDGPEGATEQDALAIVQKQHTAAQYGGSTLPTAPTETYDPTGSFLENAAAGTGKAMVGVGRALYQPVAAGLDYIAPRETGPSRATELQQNIDEAKQRDALLMKTVGGKVGGVVGYGAAGLPTLLIPGVNTYTGAALTGAGLGALTTEGDLSTRAINAGAGAVGGPLGVGIGRGVGAGANWLSQWLGRNASQNAARDAAVESAQQAGYALPPVQVRPDIKNAVVQAWGGPVATTKGAAAKNQGLTNVLAARDLELPSNTVLTRDVAEGVAAKAGNVYQSLKNVGTFVSDQPYRAALGGILQKAQPTQGFTTLENKSIQSLVADLDKPSMDSATAVELMKKLRFDASGNLASMDPTTKALGQAQKDAARALEGLVDRNLAEFEQNYPGQGFGTLADEFRSARTLIAKAKNVGKAIIGENVSAPAIVGMAKRGVPLTGGLKTIADVAERFPKATALLNQEPSPYSAVDALFGAGGLAAHVNPLYAAGIAARPLVRMAALSPAGQAVARFALPNPMNALVRVGQNPLTLPASRIIGLTGGTAYARE